MRRRALAAVALLVALAAVVPTAAATAAPTPPPSPAAAAANPIPLFAYYYIWFDRTSWRRAKIDLPLLGPYSSDDRNVLVQQVREARSAGIGGFIVSWKDTPVNDRRLALLADVAAQEHFQLAMIYQGLDFSRNPLPVSRVAADFRYFRDHFARDPVFFRLGGRPLTIWSGTWKFTHAQVAEVTSQVWPALTVLSTEKTVEGLKRLNDVTDGDAYYWSSVNPATNDRHGSKLAAMGAAAHAGGRYWIAPFAPGFDARLVGGAKSVDRAGGTTLRTEYAAAVASSPDVLGLISWNEFSENSYVEPSKRYGTASLDVLRTLRGATPAAPASTADSSEPAAARAGGGGPSRGDVPGNLVIIAGFVAALVGGTTGLVALRRRKAGPRLVTDVHRRAL